MSEIIRVEEDGVEFFTVAATGESGMSQSGLARLCGVDEGAVRKLLKVETIADQSQECRLTGWNYEDIYLLISTKSTPKNVKLVHKQFALAVIKYFYAKGFCSLEGSKLIGMPFFKQKRSQNRLESEYKANLAKILKGKPEVPTLAGNIDLLTATEIIEVKRVKDWKHAIGQVLIYSAYFPKHRKRIHLFGEIDDLYLALISNHAEAFNIIVTWEP